jgi:hypothetical protein
LKTAAAIIDKIALSQTCSQTLSFRDCQFYRPAGGLAGGLAAGIRRHDVESGAVPRHAVRTGEGRRHGDKTDREKSFPHGAPLLFYDQNACDHDQQQALADGQHIGEALSFSHLVELAGCQHGGASSNRCTSMRLPALLYMFRYS